MYFCFLQYFEWMVKQSNKKDSLVIEAVLLHFRSLILFL